jgi:hypothetical protein
VKCAIDSLFVFNQVAVNQECHCFPTVGTNRCSSGSSVGVQDTGEPSVGVQDTDEPSVGVQDTDEPSVGVQDTDEPSVGVQDTGEPDERGSSLRLR